MAAQHSATARGGTAADEFLGRFARPVRKGGKLRSVVLCAGALILLAACPASFAQEAKAQQKGIRTVAPAAGSYLITGFVAFAPGGASSEDRVRILRVGSGEEIPSAVSAEATWFDDSVKVARVAFPVEADGAGPIYFWVEWGPGVARTRPEPAAGDGGLETLYFEEAEVPSPDFDLEAGTLVVRVAPHPGLWYYLYLIPVAGIIAVLVWRKVKLSRCHGR